MSFVNINKSILLKMTIVGLLSTLLISCRFNLTPIEIEAVSGKPTTIDLQKSVENYPTDAPVYFYLKSNPKHGKISGEFPQAIYTSDRGYVGRDRFHIIAKYKGNISRPVLIKINITPNVSKDRDDDRVLNDLDAFPDDSSEIYDTDKNGIGNYAQKDEDGDGMIDERDGYPFDDTKTEIPTTHEKEFNDNINDATVIKHTLPARVQGVISQSADIDVYRFTVDSPSEISIALKKQNHKFTPSLSVLDTSGTPLSGNTKVLNAEYVAFHASISKAGDYYFQVTDSNANFNNTFTYEADLFVDADFDYVSDDLERAIGSNIKQSDSDGDEIIDFYEIIPTIDTASFDVDGDGIPNWLDKDADGNGILDSQEGIEDLDNDGIANFLDTDNDGNGIPDAEEIGSNPEAPIDTDNDGVPDYLDIDDDGDALYDSVDPDRLTAIRFSDELDVADRLIISDIRYSYGDDSVENILVPNKTITVSGIGFAKETQQNTIALKLTDGSYVLTPVTSSTGDTLTFVMPDVEVTQLFIIRNNTVRSAAKIVSTLAENMPLLFQPKLLAVEVGKRYEFRGLNFTSGSVINAGGVSIQPTNVSNTSISFIVPNEAKSGNWTIFTTTDTSNAISLDVTKSSNVQINVPQNYPLALNSLVITNENFAEFRVNASGMSDATIGKQNAGLLDIYASWQGKEGIALQAVTLPSDNQVIINFNTTAIAMASELAVDFDAMSTLAAQKLRQKISELPEVKVLEQIISTQYASNPLVVTSTNDSLMNARLKAMQAVSKLSAQALSSQSITGDESTMARTAAIPLPDDYEPKITPEQYDIKVNAERKDKALGLFGGNLTGDIEVENDTQLYLSTRIVSLIDGSELYSHVGSYLDSNMIKPQTKIFFDAQIKGDYGQCQFEDCLVEIVNKSSSKIDATASKSGGYVMTRSVIERIAVPVVQKFIGERIDGSELYQALVAASPTLIETVYNDLSDTNLPLEERVKNSGIKITKYIIKDIAINGSFSKYIQKELGVKFGEEIAKQIIKKAGLKAIPYVNVISVGYDVLKFGLVSRNVSLAISDLSTIPAQLDFEVIWPLEVVSFTPLAHDVENGSVTVTFEGIGFKKVDRSDARGNNGGGITIDTNLNVSADGRHANVTLSESELIDLQDDVKFAFFERGAPTGQSPEETLDLTAKLVIKKLAPSSVSINDELCIIGSGYSTNVSENRVHFAGENGEVVLMPSTATEYKMCLTVPEQAVSGDIYVTVDKDQTGLKKSNTAYLEVLKNDVYIRFGDNGSANDDTFALYVNGTLIHAMNAPARQVGPFRIGNMKRGTANYIRLQGISAPDSIGTYYIDIYGDAVAPQNLSGDSKSGSDLNAGTSKSWTLFIPNASANNIASRSMMSLNHSTSIERSDEVPIIWQE